VVLGTRPDKTRLHTVEQVLGDQGLEVAALSANAVLGDVHDAGIELVPQQHADGLRCQRTISAVREAPDARLLEHLLLGETPGGARLEYAAHDRRAFRVGYQAFAHRARRVQVADRRQKHPAAELQCRLHASPGPV
jgi:hypothetical protein